MTPAEVFAADEQDAEQVDTVRWAELAMAVLDAEGITDDAELSLLFLDEAAMAELNQRYLGREGPTDVLAFPLDGDTVAGARAARHSGEHGPRSADPRGPDGGFDVDPGDVPAMLGDVVVCPAVARRNAGTRTRAYEDEVALLVVHGILHLLGMDHVEDAEAAAMERRQQELLTRYHRSERADR